MPGRATAITLAAVAVAAITAGGIWWFADTPTPPPAAAPPSPSTVTVRKMDLNTTRAVAGTLGYGDTRMLKSTTGGVVTWLPATGATISRGAPLYRVDDKPVVLFYGDTPLYRKLDTPNLVGKDVKVVADNLVALGYAIGGQPRAGTSITRAGAAPVKVGVGDGVLTQSLIDAIKRWQTATGSDPAGVLDVGDVVVLSGPVRVGALQAQLGDPATNPLFALSATTKTVTVQIDASDADSHKAGDKVTVTLPDASTTGGTVSSVGTVAQGGGDGQNGSEGSGGDQSLSQKVNLVIALDDPAKAGPLDSAAVQVMFEGESRHDVLTVPVGALLAVKQGGYALQRPDGGLVPVTTGLFAQGMVEVSGAGVTEGMTVVTAS